MEFISGLLSLFVIVCIVMAVLEARSSPNTGSGASASGNGHSAFSDAAASPVDRNSIVEHASPPPIEPEEYGDAHAGDEGGAPFDLSDLM